MSKIVVQYLHEIELFLNNLSDLLFEKDYFAFIDFSENYIDNKFLLMDVASKKIELKNWIDTLTDESIIEEIMAIKTKEKSDFEKKSARSLTIEEARIRSKILIENLPWKS